MIGLDDPKWQTFNGGYRLPYDASARLRELVADSTVATVIWEEFWNELLQSFLAVAAFAKGAPKTARLLITFSDDELDEVFEKFFQ
jgi:hypothetical protein